MQSLRLLARLYGTQKAQAPRLASQGWSQSSPVTTYCSFAAASQRAVQATAEHGSPQAWHLLRARQLLGRSQQSSGWGSLAYRGFASEAEQSASQRLQRLQQQAQQALKAPRAAAQAAQSSIKNTSLTAYKQLPAPAQRWVDSVRQPGALQKALGLQLEALWHAHGNKIIVAGALVLLYVLWRTLFKVTSLFVNLSETMADMGILALAAAMVAFGFLYMRRLYRIDPNAAYRHALVKLNTSPGVLEVMGAPLVGSDIRAYVQTAGGIKMKGLTPRYRSRRLMMLFPLKGAERRGLVSLEAKKRKGKYHFKLLAVDVPTAARGEQRVFLEGDQHRYERGGIMSELRDPFLRALDAKTQNAFEQEDEQDEAEEDAQEAQEQRTREAQRLLKGPRPLDQGGGMFFWERLWHSLQGLLSRAKTSTQR